MCFITIINTLNFWGYNKPINEGVLPQSLTHLTFGFAYSEPIGVGVLPQSLTHLTFGDIINKLM